MSELSVEAKLERITKIWQEWYDSQDCSGVSALAEIGELLDVNYDDTVSTVAGGSSE